MYLDIIWDVTLVQICNLLSDLTNLQLNNEINLKLFFLWTWSKSEKKDEVVINVQLHGKAL